MLTFYIMAVTVAKLSRDEAWTKSTGIVIHGDKLAKCHLEDEEKYEDGHP